jgi:putative transcriptional regulator
MPEGRYTLIEIRIDELLDERGRTFYWLAKETGISHTTLWRLKKGRAVGINFPTLEQICRTLSCQPGDVLKLANEKKAGKKKASKKPAAAKGR